MENIPQPTIKPRERYVKPATGRFGYPLDNECDGKEWCYYLYI